MNSTSLDTIRTYARKNGFVYQSSEIYGGFAATYDFGQNGLLLKKNLEQAWRYWNVTSRTDMEEIEGAIFMHPKVWEASGHASGFSDLMVDDLKTKKRYRADHLIEEYAKNDPYIRIPSQELIDYISEYEFVIPVIISCSFQLGAFPNSDTYPEFDRYKNKFKVLGLSVVDVTEENKIYLSLENRESGYTVSEMVLSDYYQEIINSGAKVLIALCYEDKIQEKIYCLGLSTKTQKKVLHQNIPDFINLHPNLKLEENGPRLVDAGSFTSEQSDLAIKYYGIKSPDGNDLGPAKKFNLLVKTHLGPVEDDTTMVYLKGESCQNIYLNWKIVQETSRRKLPFGIAQIGKAFRNEITVKQYMFRTREFEQMDVQYFVKPGTEDEYYESWKQDRINFYTKFLKFSPDNIQMRQHNKDELVFYAKDAWDVEYRFGQLGFKEMEGVHNRTSYDTDQHNKFSGTDLTYFDTENNTRYNPYIVEMSAGFNRIFLATLFEFYNEDTITSEDGKEDSRIVIKFPFKLAPYKISVLPLMKKDGLKEIAEKIQIDLRKEGVLADYDESGSIGKRYRRQDEIGTPWCLVVDYQTKEDDTVTLRHRDTMEQVRVKIAEVKNWLNEDKFGF